MLNGLASNEVNCTIQDATGYLWIGTNNGLQRFDGIQYKTFRHQAGNAKSLPHNNIIDIVIDKRQRMFVLMQTNMVALFDASTTTSTPCVIKPRNAGSLATESRLITDAAGNLFLLLRNHELLQYIEARNEFSAIDNFIPLKPEWQITSMSQQRGTQKYWIGIKGNGIAIYNHQTKAISYAGHNLENEPAVDSLRDSQFYNSFSDAQGRMWFDTWPTVFPYAVYFDTKTTNAPLHRTELLSVLKRYNSFAGFMQQADGRIWLKGANVLGVYNEAGKKFDVIQSNYNTGQGIVYDEATHLYEDREKNVWVCSRNNGLYRCNPSKQFFTNVWHQSPDVANSQFGGVMSFYEYSDGGLLVGTWGTGMYRYNAKLELVASAIKMRGSINPFLWSAYPSPDNKTVWFGAQPGLFQYDLGTESMQYRDPDALHHKTITEVIEDDSSHLWLGIYRFGLFRWLNPRATTKDSIARIEGPGMANINCLMKDRKGIMWVATDTAGLLLYDASTAKLLKRYKNEVLEDGSRLGTGISSIVDYNDSLVVMANSSQLFFYNRLQNRITSFRSAEEFMGNVASLQKDDDGFIWVSTTNALYRVHPSQRTFLLFNRQDGIANDQFILGSSLRLRDGRLLFGNASSFIVFNPKSFLLSSMAPPVIITDIQVGKNELKPDSVLRLGQLSLPYDNNSVGFQFSTLTYAALTIVQYKMEGVDDEWKTAGTTNHIDFAFLPPGHYKLLLRSMNAEGVTSMQPTVLSIRVYPPFWQTWWFYMLLAVAMALLLYWFDRQRTKRKESLQQVRTDIANGLHREVNTALNNINILSEIARLKSDNEPQKAKEFIEQIHSKSHHMIIALDDMLWSLDPENDSMVKTVSRMKEFADALMQRYKVLIELLIEKRVEALSLDMRRRHEAFSLFKEGLGSLVDAGTPHCIVHVTAERSHLLFTIEFTNEGCNMQQLHNLLHRRDMEVRLKQLSAKLNVQIHKSRSVVILQMPI